VNLVVAAVISLSLAWAQFPAGASLANCDHAAVSACAPCTCPQLECCAQDRPGIPDSPPAPAPNLTPQQLLAALIHAAARLVSPVASAAELSPSPSTSLKRDAVPLYQRNCSYLI
jgi:hypothetical protein